MWETLIVLLSRVALTVTGLLGYHFTWKRRFDLTAWLRKKLENDLLVDEAQASPPVAKALQKTTLWLSRILTGAVLLGAMYFIWTRPVNLVEWAGKTIEKVLQVTETKSESFLRVSYQEYDDRIFVSFENTGDAPVHYFTASITTSSGVFSVDEVVSDFELSTSGEGGSWTVISAKDILYGSGEILARLLK